MINIDTILFNEIASKAKSAKRKRAHFTFHKSDDDPLQRLLISAMPGTYLQPHKHENPDKEEIIICFVGKILVVEFDNVGNITDHTILDPEIKNFAVEIPPRIYHTIICLEPNSIIYEFKNGPFTPNKGDNLADWAPKEGTNESIEFNEKILKELNISSPV